MLKICLLAICVFVMCVSGAHATIDVCLDTGAPISGATVNVNGAALAAAGTEYVRINFILGSWSSPTDTTLYNGMTWMQCYDSIVNDLISHGVKVYGLIGAESVRGVSSVNSDEFVSALTTNTLSIIDHFKDRVRVYEIYNEPNDYAGGSSAQVEPYWFAKMLQEVYLNVKHYNGHHDDPSWQVTLLSGPLFGHDITSSYADTAAPYLDQTYSAGINNLAWSWIMANYGTYPLDGIGYHTYVKQGPSTEQSVVDRLNYNVDSIWGVVANYEGSNSPKRIWISECGWNTAGVTEAEQARNVNLALDTFNIHSKVVFASWFQMCDFGVDYKWGLFRTTPFTDVNKKPAWAEFHDWAVNNHGTGTISGTVKDTGGIAISGATVSTDIGGYSATTNSSGGYTISNVENGNYSITASKTGYTPQTYNAKTIAAGATTTVNFSLQSTTGMNSNVPTGANLALKVTQISTDSNYSSSYDGNKARDGSTSTKWCTTNAISTHWMVYDLGASYSINGYIVKLASAGGESTSMNLKNFKIQSGTSMVGPWTDETVVDNSAQAGTINRSYTTAKSIRYIRIYVTNSGVDNYCRLPEFEVRGTDPGMNTNTPSGINVGLSATSYATDSNYSSSYAGDKAKDGVVSQASKWCSTGTVATHWLSFDLGSLRTVKGFIVRHAGAAGESTLSNTQLFRLQSSTSMSGPWVDEVSVDNSAQANVTSRSYVTPKAMRYVRLYITDPGADNYARIPEFEVIQ